MMMKFVDLQQETPTGTPTETPTGTSDLVKEYTKISIESFVNTSEEAPTPSPLLIALYFQAKTGGYAANTESRTVSVLSADQLLLKEAKQSYIQKRIQDIKQEYDTAVLVNQQQTSTLQDIPSVLHPYLLQREDGSVLLKEEYTPITEGETELSGKYLDGQLQAEFNAHLELYHEQELPQEEHNEHCYAFFNEHRKLFSFEPRDFYCLEPLGSIEQDPSATVERMKELSDFTTEHLLTLLSITGGPDFDQTFPLTVLESYYAKAIKGSLQLIPSWEEKCPELKTLTETLLARGKELAIELQNKNPRVNYVILDDETKELLCAGLESEGGKFSTLPYTDEVMSLIAPMLSENTVRKMAEACAGEENFLLTLKSLLTPENINVGLLTHRNDFAETLLHIAAMRGSPDVLELLLDKGADLDTRECNGHTPLHLAVLHHRDPDIAELLIRAGADPEARCHSGRTALHWLGEYECLSTAKILLERGASPNVTDEFGNTPLHLAALIGLYETAKLLLKHGANSEVKNDLGKTPCSLATEFGNLNIVMLLPKQEGWTEAQNNCGNAPFHSAAVIGDLDMIKFLIVREGVDLESENAFGHTALYMAAECGHADVVAFLLHAGADPEARSHRGFGSTPLEIAHENHDPITAYVLLKHGANPENRMMRGGAFDEWIEGIQDFLREEEREREASNSAAQSER